MIALILIWTILSVLIESGLPALIDVSATWKKVVYIAALAPAHALIAGKNLLRKRPTWFEKANVWLKS